MANIAGSGERVTGSYRAAFWMSFPIIAFVALRKVTASQNPTAALGLLGVYLLLLVTMGAIARRIKGYI
ncbi:MAG: hypothetical protein ACWGO1_11425, partial [Anaerolineales bacterium]